MAIIVFDIFQSRMKWLELQIHGENGPRLGCSDSWRPSARPPRRPTTEALYVTFRAIKKHLNNNYGKPGVAHCAEIEAQEL